MTASRRQALATFAALAAFLGRGESARDRDPDRFEPGRQLVATGGGVNGDGRPPVDPARWDLYLASLPEDTLAPFVPSADGWKRCGLSFSALDGREIRGVADHVATTTAELEAAFDDLSRGETIWIDGRNAPYRTTRWLDVDVDGATVVGPGLDGAIAPADGANVGGIRIGHNGHCRNVTVRGVGYHGNPKNQRDSAKKLHGIIVRDATDVVVSGNTVAWTHPYHEHGSGGSGISVERNSENVRIVNNRVHHFGDRGIQLGGKNVIVTENVVTDGIDRAIACDLWAPDGKNDVANTVIISGNVLGNCREGSLAGIASGPKGEEAEGSHSIITDNVGFGFHKSFCHVRGSTGVHNVSIRGNISTQSTDGLWTNETTKFAGIAVDPADGSSITISGNELSGYSRHGINVQSPLTDLKIANNTILDPDETGIRVKDAAEGTIIDNTVARAGTNGILLDETDAITVTNNHVRGVALAGIAVLSPGETYHELDGNYISEFATADRGDVAAIRIESSKTGVRENTIARTPSATAIREAADAGENVYESNRAEADNSWEIAAPSSVVRSHVPAFDAHRGVRDEDEDGKVEVQFDKPHRRPPKLTFARRGGGIRTVDYATDSDDNVTGAVVAVETPGETVDLFVEAV
ncbi:right-handed parallel beta-helix repeat-containing protein [Halegenticoccus tardaugens]|uniref:right-handed parallel beta-helix repeat-containing protein n=1 Tax=Halegenticoccus tardaugens TaxID=2071624 RepID=UPI00100B55FD|nr:right-handed parallel beta-helix repeat-containing protein [Halegenticoccus tardaugens]